MATINVKFLSTTRAKYEALTVDEGSFYRVRNTDNSEDFYLGSRKLNNAQDLLDSLYANRIEYKAAEGTEPAVSVKDALDELYAAVGEGGGVSEQIAAAIQALSSSVATTAIEDESGDVNVLTGVTETAGKLTAKTEQKLKKVAVSGAAADLSVADVNGNLDASDVEGALAEIITKINTTGNNGKLSIDKLSGSNVVDSNNVAEYNFYQGVSESDDATAKAAKKIGTIEIAKDMVATDGELVDEDEEGNEGTFIRMTIANGTPFYINVADLIEYNAVQSTDEITLTDTNHTFTATVGKISATKIIYKAAVEADPDNGIEAQPEQTVAQAINALESASSTGVDTKINTKIATLNSSVDAELAATETDDEAIAAISGVTEANGVLTAADSVAVDKAGAATRAKAAVIGTGTGKTGAGTDEDPYVYADTIKGAKTYAADQAAAAQAASDPAGSAAAVQSNLENALVWQEIE